VLDRRRFTTLLVALAVLGLAVRLVYALAFAPELGGDARTYSGLADALAQGQGYVSQFSVFVGAPQPTAQHPPLFPLYLAAWDKLGVDGADGLRVASALLGVITIVLIGLLGRRLAGERAGLIAAGIAAVYPQFFVVDGSLISEALYGPLVALVLLLAYRYVDRPRLLVAGALGAVVGLAALTRSEALLLLVLLAAPLLLTRGPRRVVALAVCAAAALVVVSPWLARNASDFDRFPLMSTNGGYTARATNCFGTYYTSDGIGFVNHRCATESACARVRGELEQSDCYSSEARGYLRDHLTRAPLVALARVERAWEIYGADLNLEYGRTFWARPEGLATVGLIFYVLMLPLAIAGALLLRARSVPLLPLLALFGFVTVVAALAFGYTRYRYAAEPALVALAAVGVDGLLRAAGRRSPRAVAEAVG
jgi:4-amino-4-deoxy-L-arabinose transferase-like glycosyltransferase